MAQTAGLTSNVQNEHDWGPQNQKVREHFWIWHSYSSQKLSKSPPLTPTLLCVWGSLIFSPMSRSWTSEREVRRDSSRLDRVRWTGQDKGVREGRRGMRAGRERRVEDGELGKRWEIRKATEAQGNQSRGKRGGTESDNNQAPPFTTTKTGMTAENAQLYTYSYYRLTARVNWESL